MIRLFNNATVVITGAASGIGEAMTYEFAKRGATVVLADRQIERANKVASTIQEQGGTAWALETDVSNPLDVKHLVETAYTKTQRLDIMVNNAGIGIGGLVEDHTLDDWNSLLDVNFLGMVHGIHSAYPLMIEQGFGHIVNTSSVAGLIPAPGSSAYTATKFAITGLSQALRAEAASAGVRVSVLCPGAIQTPILEGGKYGKPPKGMSKDDIRRYWGNLPVPAEKIAPYAVDKIAQNKATIIYPRYWAILCWLYRFSPRLWYSIAKRAFAKTRQTLKELNTLNNS